MAPTSIVRTAGWFGERASCAIAMLTVLLATAFPAGAQSAATLRPATDGSAVRALVIGIDHYKNAAIVPTLAGAVADARDIEQSLRQSGVGDITLLLDAKATRTELQYAFAGLRSRVGPGDLVIVTFAGHGSQEEEHRPGSEPDGKDEFFLLWGFGISGDDTSERLLDDEMYMWIGQLAGTGAQTIFLADICHGGGLTKAAAPSATQPGLRGLRRVENPSEAGPGAYFIAPGEDRLTLQGVIPASDDATRLYPSLTFLAGADDQTPVLEAHIPGEKAPRGAASYAFSRALRGDADRLGDSNGVTSRAELMGFLRRQVTQLTASKQSVVFEPRLASTAQTPMFRTDPAAQAMVSPAILPDPNPPAPKDHASVASAGASPLQNVIVDKRTGNILTANGVTLAYGLAPDEVGGLADRFEAEARFEKLHDKFPLAVSISPVPASYAKGEVFEITASGLYGRHLILLNLGATGGVQYIFPVGDTDPAQSQDRISIPMRVEPPFGSDSLVLIATEKRQRDLELDLSLLNGKQAGLAAYDAVARTLSVKDRIGVVKYRTRP